MLGKQFWRSPSVRRRLVFNARVEALLRRPARVHMVLILKQVSKMEVQFDGCEREGEEDIHG